MDVAQYLGDVRVVVGIDVRRLPGDDVERHHHDVFPFRFGVADQPVDQPCHVVAALLDALAERRKVRGGELADRLVVVYPRMAMSFGIREFPSIWRHASVIWYAWLSSQAMMATGLGSDCSHVMSCAVS